MTMSGETIWRDRLYVDCRFICSDVVSTSHLVHPQLSPKDVRELCVLLLFVMCFTLFSRYALPKPRVLGSNSNETNAFDGSKREKKDIDAAFDRALCAINAEKLSSATHFSTESLAEAPASRQHVNPPFLPLVIYRTHIVHARC